MSVEFVSGSPGMFDSRTLNRKTLWTGRSGARELPTGVRGKAELWLLSPCLRCSNSMFWRNSKKKRTQPLHTRVCEENTPREKKTCGKIGLQSTKLGAGEQFRLQDCRAKARTTGMCFHRHRYDLREMGGAPRNPAPRSHFFHRHRYEDKRATYRYEDKRVYDRAETREPKHGLACACA